MVTRRRDLPLLPLATSRKPTNPPQRILSGLVSSKLTLSPLHWWFLRLISLNRGNDVGYIATIQVGTPPRDFSVLVDSGSADLWVGGEGCKSVDGGCVRVVPSPSQVAQSRSVLIPFYRPGQSHLPRS